MLDQAFEALKTFDFGTSLNDVSPIEDAAVAAHADPAIRKDLEQRLVAALPTSLSRDARDYVCRKLALVGTASSVPALAQFLTSEENAHLARHALERIPGPDAAAALANALAKTTGKLKIGVIGSLGARREPAAIAVLAPLVRDADPAVSRAALLSLGTIGGSEAARILQEVVQSATGNKPTAVDALLSCAESLLSSQKSADAVAIYKSLSGEQQPRIVRLAATRGLLACASQQS